MGIGCDDYRKFLDRFWSRFMVLFMSTSLSAEEAAKLLALPTRTRSESGTNRQVPGTSGRSVKIDTNDRSWPMWWKLFTQQGECEVPNHDEEESERNRMCAVVDGIRVCRYCYVTSRDKNERT